MNGLFRVPDLYHHLLATGTGLRRGRVLALPLLDDPGRAPRSVPGAIDRDALPPRRGVRRGWPW